MKFSLFTLTVLLGLGCSTSGADDSVYAQLRRQVTADYDPKARPGTPDKPISVEFGMNVVSMTIDEWKSALHANGFIFMAWQDTRLQWDPAQFSGIDTIRISPRDIWLPDIFLYNEVPGFPYGPEAMDKLALIFSNGTVLWVPSVSMKSNCVLDLMKYPRDHQKCTMIFGSWTYDKKEIDVDLSMDPIRQLSFVDNSQWHLDGFYAEKKDTKYPGVDGIYPTLNFVFFLHRNVLPYCITLYTPILACILASISGLLVCQRGTSYHSELLMMGLITISILMTVAMYHGVALNMSVCGIPYIMRFIGALMITEAMLLVMKGIFTHFIAGVNTIIEKEINCQMPRFASDLINFNFFRRNAQKADNNGNADQTYLLASETKKKNAADWARLAFFTWSFMFGLYMLSLLAIMFTFLFPAL